MAQSPRPPSRGGKGRGLLEPHLLWRPRASTTTVEMAVVAVAVCEYWKVQLLPAGRRSSPWRPEICGQVRGVDELVGDRGCKGGAPTRGGSEWEGRGGGLEGQ